MINDKINEIAEKYKFNSFDRFENKTRRKSETDVIKI